MTTHDELIKRVARAIHKSMGEEGSAIDWQTFKPDAIAAISAVRAFDAEHGGSGEEVVAARDTFRNAEAESYDVNPFAIACYPAWMDKALSAAADVRKRQWEAR